MKNLGQLGEDLVAGYYQNLGFKVLDRNFIFPYGKQMGEIDLVVMKKNELVFVEVKTRSNNSFGSAFDSIDIYKQRKLIKMVHLYFKLKPHLANTDYRIDVAAVDIDNKDQPVIILTNAIDDLT